MAKMAAVLQLLEEEEEEEKSMFEEEEEEELALRRWCVRPLNTTRREQGEYSLRVNQMRNLDEEMHFSYFRMSASRFDDLLRRVEPLIQHAPTHSTPISASERLAVALRVLASGSSRHRVATSYKMGLSTVSTIVSEVSRAIWLGLKDDFVSFPSPAQLRDVGLDFWRLWSLPNCVGAIDCRRVKIKAPPNAGSDFHHHKGHHSIVVMAVCDARYRFTMVDVDACGGESDSGVFQESALGSGLQREEIQLPPPAALPGRSTRTQHVVLGHAAFPLLPNLMSPYSGNHLTEKQLVYNQRHSHACQVIENAFGVLAARWRILGRPLECSPEKAGDIVNACVALHNYLTCMDDSNGSASRYTYIPANFTDATTASGDLRLGEWRRQVEGDTNLQEVPGTLSAAPHAATRAACVTRADLTEYFLTPEGRVPWQENIVRCHGSHDV